MIGQTLRHYRITARLGAGGMGEVYRAEDQQLQREVALKILPADVAGDPKRVARFRREARALAALNHPNIVTLYSIDEQAEPPFLTMELIEGQTLAEVIPHRGLDIDRFFSLAIPMVDAVATAHAAGVVHRDLKPSNVMLGREGRLKVLDFGLATDDRSELGPDSETATAQLTTEGQVVGTVAYMSPEQVRGEAADGRSDIFALGILLYQLATGRSPFRGSSSVDMMSSILRDEPTSATEINLDLPPHLARIIGRCLKKDPDERYQSARDLRFGLEELQRELDAGEAVARARDLGRAPRRDRSTWRIVAGFAIAAGLGGALLTRSLLPTAARQELAEAQLALPVVTWPTEEGDARLSPDGEWLAFVSDRDGSPGLWIQRVEGGEAHALLPGVRRVESLTWSPRGDEIAALTRDQAEYRVVIVPAPLGGSPRLSLEVRSAQRLVAWVDRTVFFEVGQRLFGLDLESTEWTETEIAGDEFEHRRQHDVSADGRWIVFSAQSQGREDLWEFDRVAGRTRPLTAERTIATHPHCVGAACDRVVYLSNRTGQTDLWMLDRRRGQSRQLRVPAVVQRISSVSLDGAVIVLRVVDEDVDLWRYDFATRSAGPLTGDSLTDFAPSAARRGSRLAFQRSRPATEIESRFLDARILTAEWRRGRLDDARPLGDGGYAPLISPEGRYVAFLKTSRQGRAPYYTELWVGDTLSGRTRRLSGRFQMIGYWELPAGLLGRSLAWLSEDELVFVEADDTVTPTILTVDLASDSPEPIPVASLEPMTQIEQLLVSANGEIVFSAAEVRPQNWRVAVVARDAAPESIFTRPAESGTYRLVGRRELDGGWVVLAGERAANVAGRLEVLALGRDGSERPLARVESGVASTAVLSADGAWLYLSIAVDDRVAIGALDLSTGELSELVSTDLPGVTFGGIEPLADALVFSRQQRNADLWLLQRRVTAAEQQP